MIFLGFLTTRDEKMEEREWSLAPMILDAPCTTLPSLVLSCIPDKDGEREDAFNSGSVKMDHDCLTDFKFPELTQWHKHQEL